MNSYIEEVYEELLQWIIMDAGFFLLIGSSAFHRLKTAHKAVYVIVVEIYRATSLD